MNATATKVSEGTLRSYCLQDFIMCDDRTTIQAKGEAIRNNDTSFYTMMFEAFELEITIDELKSAYQFVLADIDKEHFDIDEYETGYSEDEGYDFTDLFAGIESLFEKLYESTMVANLCDSNDMYYLDFPDEKWVDGEPLWYEFLKECTDPDLKCVTFDESNRYGKQERSVFYFVRPSEKKELETKIAEWAEQFIQKYTVKCSYLGYSVERKDLKTDELKSAFEDIDQCQEWPEGVFKFSGTDLKDDFNNCVSWVDDEDMVRDDDVTESGIFKGFDDQYYKNTLSSKIEKLAAINTLLSAAKEDELTSVLDEDGDLDYYATIDMDANAKAIEMLDEAYWTVVSQ